jgi:hypothetical protein
MRMELHVSEARGPGSNPGGSTYGAIAQLVEHEFHQTLSSQFYRRKPVIEEAAATPD